ncbi:hypothetical protein MUK42_20541 [Musa troglodytarum]|uniref:Uncharacterized protein n=1 Tax=Musa troglodytarum TaxID=320322 RepID=A0A9E7K3K9_9LILI|nr:hypothetical protein MUK42_20541 [Musa troglodytarum]
MGSYGGGKREDSRFAWNVFDSVKAFPPPTPEALMDDIDAAISALEYARSTAALLASSSSKVEEEAAPESEIYQPPATSSEPIYDKRIADEAYKAACAALAAGKTDAAIRSLHLSSGKDHGSRQTPLPARPRLLSAAKAATTALATASENKCRLPSNVSESLPELIKVACAGFYSSCLSTPSSLSSGFKTSVAVKTLGRWWELSTEETGEHQQCSLRLVGRNHVPCSPYRNKRQCSITNHIASSYLITYIQKLQKHQI